MAEPTPTDLMGEELVLGLLAEATEGFLTGEAIADKLGLPRVELFRRIDGLRSKGYRIDALPGRGYRLVGVPDRLTSLELGPLLSTHSLGRTLHACDEVASTNDVARGLAEKGAVHGEVVVAESQSRGRGRRGRAWVSPPGVNLYLSVVLRPSLSPERAPELTLVAAVAIAEVLREAGFDARIKWPNDILIGGRKVAGLLLEMDSAEGELRYVVLGVGVNVNLEPAALPEGLAATATSLRAERGEAVPRVFLLAALLAGIEGWLDRHELAGFEGVRQRWRELSATLGDRVKVSASGERIEGVALDIDDSGALIVEDAAGARHRVVAGDVEQLR